MTEAPRVSVVVPAWNREAEIGRSVASVLRQTMGDLEVVVVDDASADGTVAAIETMADPRVRLIRHTANRGGAAARNTGIAAARADWIAFQDSDDEWLPEKLERQFAAIRRLGSGTIGAYCGMIVLERPDAVSLPRPRYWPRPRFGVPTEGALLFSLMRSGSLISTQTFLGRRTALEAAGGFDERLKALQDYDLFLRVAAAGPIAFEPEPLVIQRFSPNSLTRSAPNRALALAMILEKHEDAFLERRMERVLAAHCLFVAGGLRRAGDRTEARRWLAKARRLDPRSLKVWARTALLELDALGIRAQGGA